MVRSLFRRLAEALTLLLLTNPLAAQDEAGLPLTFILSSEWDTPSDPAARALYPDPGAVRAAELALASRFYGGDYGADDNRANGVLDYIYIQKLDFSPGLLESALRHRMTQARADYEAAFLHFSEDTWLAPPGGTIAVADTPLGGKPAIAGYTNSWTHAGFTLSGSGDGDAVFARYDDGGGLYIYADERFDAITLTLSKPAGAGTLIVQVPVKTDRTGLISQWRRLEIADGTHALTQSGTIRFAPPADWVRGKTHDGSGQSYGGGQFFGSAMLRDGGRLHALRLFWKPARKGETQPRLSQARLRPILIEAEPGVLVVPGWDNRNDPNGDGYIDDDEFSRRINKAASARFRHESRVPPLGRHHAGLQGWHYTHVGEAAYCTALADELAFEWAKTGQQGAYNDDFFRRPSLETLAVRKGGTIAEYGLKPSKALERAYAGDFAACLRTIKTKTGGHLATNISGVNLIPMTAHAETLALFDSLLREDMVHVSTGLIGYSGLLMFWDVPVLAARGISSAIQAQTRNGRVTYLGNTKAHWDADLAALAAQSYLLHVPGYTRFSYWSSSYYYGGALTDETNFHTPGVPRNLAYIPPSVRKQGLGAPENVVPSGFLPVTYFQRTGDDFRPIGTSMDHSLHVQNDAGVIKQTQTIPTGLFFVWQKGKSKTLPDQAVIARLYRGGLVVFRTSLYGRSPGDLSRSSITVDLNSFAPRRFCNSSGPVNQIDLRLSEGLVLRNCW